MFLSVWQKYNQYLFKQISFKRRFDSENGTYLAGSTALLDKYYFVVASVKLVGL